MNIQSVVFFNVKFLFLRKVAKSQRDRKIHYITLNKCRGKQLQLFG